MIYLPYYETRANYNGLLRAKKLKINDLENNISEAKLSYNESLKNLEQISEEIHRQREKTQKINYEEVFNEVSIENIGLIKDNKSNLQSNIDSIDKYIDIPDKLNSNCNLSNNQTKILQDHAVLQFPHKLSHNVHELSKEIDTELHQLCPQTSKRNLHENKINSKFYESINATKNNESGTSYMSFTNTGLRNDNEVNYNEHWTEIRLSHSESSSSSYSNQSLLPEQCTTGDTEDTHSQYSSSTSSDDPKPKITCTTMFHDDSMHKKNGLSQWLSLSNNFKSTGRRPSLDILIDAGDKVKDVFSIGFQKVGKTLERRNSESEMNNEIGNGVEVSSSTSEFFLFSRSCEPRQLLSDEQIENLLLNHIVDENGTIMVENFITPQENLSPAVKTSAF